MKIEKITYSQSHETLSSIGLRTWYKFEAGGTVDQGENMEEAVATLKKFVQENVFPDLWMANEYMGGYEISKEKVDPNDRVSGIAEAIKSCTTPVALERFRQMVERENVDSLYEAYANKKKQLQ